MEKQYIINGMTCGSCVAKVKQALESVPGVDSAEIKLESRSGTLHMESEVSIQALHIELARTGNYSIESNINIPRSVSNGSSISDTEKVTINTYKPLLLIVAFIAGTCLLVQFPFHQFSILLWMRHFMAGFFISFAFFKLLNLRGFADSYRMYDIVAAKWYGWGFVYPFLELLLGILYLIDFSPFLANLSTVLLLGVSSIGVIKSNLDRRKIKCACLGDVFNLPMSTVTIIEDLSMVVMALIMLSLN